MELFVSVVRTREKESINFWHFLNLIIVGVLERKMKKKKIPFSVLAEKELISGSEWHCDFYTCLGSGFIHRLHRYYLNKTSRENMGF